MDAPEYCREIEAYLCRKNEGHLVRIVGPAFEQVCGWAAQGVPLAVARRGIDRYCERYYAKGPRRRPVRIEHCEADILELFDDWRRAVGVTRLTDEAGSEGSKRDTLPAHVDRVIAKLTALRSSASAGPGRGPRSAALDRRLDDAVRELDTMRARAAQARGDARAAFLERLSAIDAELLAAARAELDARERSVLRAEAETEIAPFVSRMTPEARQKAADAAFDRLVRESLSLPVLSHHEP